MYIYIYLSMYIEYIENGVIHRVVTPENQSNEENTWKICRYCHGVIKPENISWVHLQFRLNKMEGINVTPVALQFPGKKHLRKATKH